MDIMTHDGWFSRENASGIYWGPVARLVWCGAAAKLQRPRWWLQNGPTEWLQCHQWNGSGNWFWQNFEVRHGPTLAYPNFFFVRNPCCKVYMLGKTPVDVGFISWLPTSNSFLNTPLRVTTSLDHAPVYSRILKSERHFKWKWGGGRYPNGSEYGRYTWVYNGIHISCKIGCQ